MQPDIREVCRCQRAHRRVARLLWSAQRGIALGHPTRLLLERSKHSGQARGLHRGVSPRGRYRGVREPEHALSDDEHAGGDIAILEYRLRPNTRRGGHGQGGDADDADTGPQHGLAIEVDQRREGPRPPSRRALGCDELRPLGWMNRQNQ